MGTGFSYPREMLAEAVASSHSSRGVLRHLRCLEHSAGALRAVRREVAAFGIDHSHFTGQRRWSDRQLKDAIAQSRSWSDTLRRLGVSGGNHVSVRAAAARLGLDTSHFSRRSPGALCAGEPQLSNLRVAGGRFHRAALEQPTAR